MGSGISVEESSIRSSCNVLADHQSTCLQSSSSDVESFKREPEPVEPQKVPPSNNQVESNMPTPLGLLGGLQTKVMQLLPLVPDLCCFLYAVISATHQVLSSNSFVIYF